MWSEIFQAIGWVLVGMVLMGLIVWFAMPRMMLVTHKSRRGYVETVAALSEAVKRKQDWKVLAVNDYQQAAAPFAALEHVGSVNVCNPRYASNILLSDANRIVSAFMPLAVGVYEDKKGQVYVTEMNVGLMGRMFGRHRQGYGHGRTRSRRDGRLRYDEVTLRTQSAEAQRLARERKPSGTAARGAAKRPFPAPCSNWRFSTGNANRRRLSCSPIEIRITLPGYGADIPREPKACEADNQHCPRGGFWDCRGYLRIAKHALKSAAVAINVRVGHFHNQCIPSLHEVGRYSRERMHREPPQGCQGR
jgi:uncharacterized protein (DUF302 family)